MDIRVSDIVKAYYAKGLILTECSKVCSDAYLCADLAQEVTLIMLDKPADLVEELNRKGEFLCYVYAIAKKQFCSKTSPFYAKYKKFNIKSEDIDEEKV